MTENRKTLIEYRLTQARDLFQVAIKMILKATTPNPSLSRRGAYSPPPILGGARGGKVSA
jgi:hypothetical protein